MRILVCDDDQTTRFVLTRFLGREPDCTVVEAVNGADGLRALAEEAYDLVILDLDMPVMSGREVLRVIRETPALRGIAVVVLTGEREAETVQHVIKLGVQAFLLKPVARADAQDRLRDVLATLRVPSAPPAS